MCSMQSKHGIVKFLLDDYSSMFKNCICSNAGKKNIRLRATDMQKKKDTKNDDIINNKCSSCHDDDDININI